MKNMDVLTKEQKEYVFLKGMNERMYSKYNQAQLVIPPCSLPPIESNGESVIEDKFYLFLEMLEGKHNGFLQSIIGKAK